ncbi:hypothetical protein ACFE04_008680 [Oxalis oulophora]
MGKRVKKKSQTPLLKGKPVEPHSPKTAAQETSPSSIQTVDTTPKDRKSCSHFEKGLNIETLSSKIKSDAVVRCEDCRESANDKRGGSKAKGKHGKKKGSSSAESKSIWVCMECGHYTCAGVGFPTSSQYHAIRHFRQHRHPVFIQWGKPSLRWCFTCNSLIPVEKVGDNGENKDALSDIVKLIKTHSSEGPPVYAEELRFGSGSILSEVKSQITVTDISGSGYVVRGLVNLGNTCFFNSIMQNLLAVDRLRDYFLNHDVLGGALTISLKKLYSETKPESGLKNIINPRSVFGCLCTKAPQFKGYQQHDSHELLRCLLDELHTEEVNARKQIKHLEQNSAPSNLGSLFVDDIFGGQISSTVRCVECGHHSTVYEPFLDLSLPVPSKKPSPKKVPPIVRAKKMKLPPKRNARVRPKTNKDADLLLAGPAQSISNTSESNESRDVPQISETPPKNTLASPNDSEIANSDVTTIMTCENAPVTQGTSALPEQATTCVDEFSWLDYIEPTFVDELSWMDYIEPEIISDKPDTILQHELDEAARQDSSLQDLGKGEFPIQVQDSEVLLLPYREESSTLNNEAEATSSVAGVGQDEEFGGFGDLFNEPEVEGPLPRPSSGSGVTGTGFSSESDPCEVDDSDSPVSVERCLAHFVKPELLSNENAWECEKCTKTTVQKLIAKMKDKKESKLLANGGPTRSQSEPQICKKEMSYPLKAMGASDDNLVESAGKIDSSNEDGTIVMENEQVSGVDEVVRYTNNETSDKHEEKSQCCDSNQPNITGSLVNYESEESENEETNSKTIKVKRDAKKRVLVSKAPPVLTIHLKRFSQDVRGRLSKLNGHVSFRETIDLKPYMDSSCIDQDEYIYRLIGVVEHQGSMRGGHYVAYIRGGEKSGSPVWYHASDTYVREVSVEEVFRSEAYILFYEKI